MPLSPETSLLRTLAVILLALWLVGAAVEVGGDLIHFLLVMAGLMYFLHHIPHGSSGAR